MGRGMSDEVSTIVVQALNRGLPRNEISNVVGMSKRSITRVSTNLKKHGSPRAPPTGIKLGRPGKMNTAQAQAMLDWVAEHDCTFYVKDLVQFLKANHEYRGCEGTARRSLVKAGYRRKVPWHKSEITVWVPPEEPPSVAAIAAEGDNKVNTGTDPEQSAADNHDIENIGNVDDGIDPALSDPMHGTNITSEADRQQASEMVSDLSHPDFPASFVQAHGESSLSLASVPNMEERPPTSTSQTQDLESSSAPSRKRPRLDNGNTEVLEQQVTSLQDQVFQQQALIMTLHRQLEESRQSHGSTEAHQQQSFPASDVSVSALMAQEVISILILAPGQWWAKPSDALNPNIIGAAGLVALQGASRDILGSTYASSYGSTVADVSLK
ncbi:MAG: hypothetical protein M1828_004582 [Chrysothrix sp. TS-e1954]|nr:MAG: hypothetical protein M1828_004582 [Chrysothrix sp. TS-e1954]